MKSRYTRRAVRDLAEYVRARNPSAARAVRNDILRSVRNLILFPAVGRPQNVEGVRKLVTPRHRYLLYYTIGEAGEEIVILTIQHPARRREYHDR